MDHLGRADAVDDAQARRRVPGIGGRLRQRFAGGDAAAQARNIATGEQRHERAIRRRRREQSGGAKARDGVEQVVGRRLLDQRNGAAAAEREHEQRSEPESEAERRTAGVDVVGRGLEQVPADDVAHDEHVAMEMHRRLRIAGRAGREGEQADVVHGRRDVSELVRALRHQTFEVSIAVGRDARQATGRARSLVHLAHEPRFANRVVDVRTLGNDDQLLGAQHRHGRHRDRAHFHHGEPARNQRRRVRAPQQHAVARHDAEIAHQNVGDAIGALEQLEVAPATALGVQRNARSMAFENRVVEQHRCAVQTRRIVQLRQIEAEFGPLLARRQAVAREGIDVRRIRVVGRRMASVHVTAARTA